MVVASFETVGSKPELEYLPQHGVVYTAASDVSLPATQTSLVSTAMHTLLECCSNTMVSLASPHAELLCIVPRKLRVIAGTQPRPDHLLITSNICCICKVH